LQTRHAKIPSPSPDDELDASGAFALTAARLLAISRDNSLFAEAVMRIACITIGLLAFTSHAPAQSSDDPPAMPLPVDRGGPADYLLSECPAPCSTSSTVDFIFGLPTGFRFQRAMSQERQWHLEGFVGFELIFPIAGGGVRRRYEPFCGQHDALVVAPGVDAYLLINPFHNETNFIIGGGPPLGLAMTADVDVMWRHSFGSICESQLGVKLGAGVGYGASWGVLPVSGVFGGIRW
jgi:hypothetical protein